MTSADGSNAAIGKVTQGIPTTVASRIPHLASLLIAGPMMVGALWLPPVELPGSYLEAMGIGCVSATFALAWARLKRAAFPFRRWPWAIVWCLLARAFFAGFLRWKALVAETGFPWEERLATMDGWLHGGPAADLLPHSPLFLASMDTAYYAWFPVMTLGILWTAWNPDIGARVRIVLAFVLTWVVLGIIAAIAFASAGPIFNGASTGGDGTIAMRDMLWSAYTAGRPTSISAFPSLHVAIPTLFALAARGIIRWVFCAYAVVILLASISLQWHYAIDGYAAVLGVLAIWLFTGLLHADPTRDSPPDAAAAAGG